MREVVPEMSGGGWIPAASAGKGPQLSGVWLVSLEAACGILRPGNQLYEPTKARVARVR